MRKPVNPQLEPGAVRIEDIEQNLKSRDVIPAPLIGLQHLCPDPDFRGRLFALMEEHILPGPTRPWGVRVSIGVQN